MYLTQDDLDKIKNYIGKTGIKDSDFPLLTRGTGNELLVILSSDNKNNRISIQTFFEIAKDINNKTLLGKEIEFLGNTYNSVGELFLTILLYLKDLLSNSNINIGATSLLKVDKREELYNLPFNTLDDVVILAYIRSEKLVVYYYPLTKNIETLKGEDAYQITIISSAGQFVKNGVFNSILRAYVYCGGSDITESLGSTDCKWVIHTGNTISDEIWNQKHEAVGPVIVINTSLVGNATIECIVDIK